MAPMTTQIQRVTSAECHSESCCHLTDSAPLLLIGPKALIGLTNMQGFHGTSQLHGLQQCERLVLSAEGFKLRASGFGPLLYGPYLLK